MLRPLFTADSDEAAHELVGDALGRLRKPLPKVAAVLVLGRAGPARLLKLPSDHRPKLRSTNPLERINREIGRAPTSRHLPLRPLADPARRQHRDRAGDEGLVGRRYLSNHLLEAILDHERQRPREDPRAHTRPDQPTTVSTSYTTSWNLANSRLKSGSAPSSVYINPTPWWESVYEFLLHVVCVA
jgi:Transposase, Mutator family